VSLETLFIAAQLVLHFIESISGSEELILIRLDSFFNGLELLNRLNDFIAETLGSGIHSGDQCDLIPSAGTVPGPGARDDFKSRKDGQSGS